MGAYKTILTIDLGDTTGYRDKTSVSVRPLPFHSNIVLAPGQEKFIAWGRVNMFDQPSVQ